MGRVQPPVLGEVSGQFEVDLATGHGEVQPTEHAGGE
jgi:hypothetical protein